MIFIVYTKAGCKEFVIANSDNTVLKIDRCEFAVESSLILKAEKLDGRHILFSDENCSFIEDGIRKNSVYLDDTLVACIETNQGSRLMMIAVSEKAEMPRMKKYILETTRSFTIGTDNCDITYRGIGFVSSYHAELVYQSGGWYVRDNSKNGTFLNGKRVKKTARLHFGDEIYIFGLKLVYFGTIIAVGSLVGEVTSANVRLYDTERNVFGKTGNGTQPEYFNRSPRNLPSIYNGEISIDAPPETTENNQKNLFSAIGRPLTMAVPMLLGCVMMGLSVRGNSSFMMLGVITSVSSAIIGAVWTLLNLNEQDSQNAKKELKRFNTYGNYLISIANDLSGKYWHNYQSMNQIYPSASVCLSYGADSVGLWNRNSTHADFLFARLGLGNIPFQFEIKTPKRGFTVSTDMLLDCPGIIKNEYETLNGVPVGIDLMANRIIGIIGRNSFDNAVKVTQLIVSQIAASVSYTDIRIVLLNSKNTRKDIENWSFMRWLPHCWSEDKKTRFFSMDHADASDVSYELLDILRRRATAEFSQNEKVHYIVIVTDMSLLERNLLSTYLLEPKESYGVTTLLLSRSLAHLPNTCSFSVESDGTRCFVNSNMLDVNETKTEILQDSVSVQELDAFAHRMANIAVEEKEVNLSIPSKVDFLSMYDATNVHDLRIIEKWKNARISDTINVPIGVKAGGELCCLDIHEKFHGPHGLVAGTTGSGKSELLQSYILSLCVNFSPEDINFFIIDYKGGGMANLFAELPHMVGQITNLSGNQIRRAMISIKSESVRRQRLFSEYGVNSINQYTRLYKDGATDVAIPHLLIIIDEFAELKKAEPDFMRELISVAQVGRSLGIHLILATQKPSGIVDDNIRSNSKFRLCLRVQDKQDSMDMIHHTDAAYITQAGGCIMQVGNDEIFEKFQSAWSGDVYSEDDVKNDNVAVLVTSTGKPALAGNRSKIKRSERRRTEWYTGLVHSIRSITGDSCIYSELAEHQLTQLQKELTERFSEGESVWKHNPALLKSMLRLWPENGRSMADREIAEFIVSNAADRSVKLPSPEEKKQLDAVVSEIISVAERNNCKSNYKLWLPLLPRFLTLPELSCWNKQSYTAGAWERTDSEWTLQTVVGMVDDPVNQAQEPVYVDFAHGGNHAVIGTVVSGKSVFMQTVLYGLVNSYTPEQLNMYIVDFSSKMLNVFDGVPHVGGVVNEGEEEKLEKLFRLISDILAYRKDLLCGGSYSEYARTHRNELPAVILAIDNYSSFKEKTESKYESLMMQLSREGVGYGIYLLVSASGFGMNEITNRMAENFKTVFTLELTDKFKYVDSLRTTAITVLPETGVHGRGLVKHNGECLEYQTALINSGMDDYSRIKEAEALFREMRDNWHGSSARKIPQIPKNLVYSEFSRSDEFRRCLREHKIPLGYNTETAELFSLDLSELYTYLILGQPHSGKTNVLQLIMNAVTENNGSKIVLYSKNNPYLKDFAEKKGAEIISDSKSLFEFFKRLTPVFVERNKEKNRLINEGYMENEIFEKMQKYEPMFIFVDELEAFFNDIYEPGEGVGKMNGFVENILDKGRLHNIYFIGSMNAGSAALTNRYKGFMCFNKEKKGMLLSTSVSSQRILDFGKISFSEGGDIPEKGTAFTQICDGNRHTLCKTVLPISGR